MEVLGEVRRPRLLTACNGNSVGFGVLFVCGFCYHALLIGAFENVALKKEDCIVEIKRACWNLNCRLFVHIFHANKEGCLCPSPLSDYLYF